MIEQTQVEIDFSAKLEKRMKAVDQNDYTQSEILKSFNLDNEIRLFNEKKDFVIEETKIKEESLSLLDKLLEIAAVSGGFKPANISKNVSEENSNQQDLSRLGSFCLVENRGTEIFWTLKQSQRTFILNKLLKDKNRFKKLLSQKLPSTDVFGKLLRAVLRQDKIKLETLGNERLLALTAVVETLEGLREILIEYNEKFLLPTVEQIRPLIQKVNFLSDYDVLLENGFYGREKELKQLDDFLQLRQLPRDYPYWNGVVLTGIGGAGKTTLLAKFIRDAVAEKKASVAVLDFDRPGIDPNDFYWLEAEISRQIGQQYSEITETLRGERKLARRDKLDVAQSHPNSEAETVSESRGSRLLDDVRHKLNSVITAADKPFLLVLDTFEEAAQQGFTDKMFNWLNEFGEIFYPSVVKVVFSGRLFNYRDSFPPQPALPEIEVGEFEPFLAEKFLEKLGVSSPTARRLAESNVLPHRPLELKLLAKLILENSSESIEELENEIRAGGEKAKELFAGIVYRRILLRIKDDTVRQFAYPGLTLRYLTSELLQKVLVPSLDIPPLSEAEAGQALEKLSSYGWLTYKGENGELWHRKDLRRSMLKAMMHEQAEVCARINNSAVQFFKDGNEQERAEATYHRLMLIKTPQEGESIESSDLIMAREYLGADIADFPPVPAAVLRFISEKKTFLEEIELLPKKYLADAYQDAGNNLTSGREFQKALRLINRGKGTQIAYRKDNFGNIPQWEADTLYATASWAELIKIKKNDSLKSNLSSLSNLTKLLFPALIIEPTIYSTSEIEKMLQEAHQQKGLHIGNILNAELTTNLSRLAMCLIIADNHERFSKQSREIIKFIFKQIHYSKGQNLSASIGKKLTFLQLLVEENSEFDASIAHSTLQLNLQWLSALLELSARFNFNEEMKNLIAEVKSAFENQLNSPAPRTVRKLLNAVDGLRRKASDSRRYQSFFNPRKVGSKVILKFFRGSDPELRDPCRFALLEAFPDRASYNKLGEIFASVIKLELDDLKSENFAEALFVNAEHALESYIEMIDRQWRLGELLERAFQERPESQKLQQVLTAYERWDEAVRSACLKQNENQIKNKNTNNKADE